MPVLKLVTLNILNDLSRWPQRRSILAAQMADLQPDVITLQEVALPENSAQWLADQLGGYCVSFCPRTHHKGREEGIAILSRYPIVREATLDLQTQNRVAQLIEINFKTRSLIVANAHLFWWPGESIERDQQARLILKWLNDVSSEAAIVLCGDFNATPRTNAITIMRERFASAYATRHGGEPEYTCPTPLAVGTIATSRDGLRAIRRVIVSVAANRTLKPWRGTLDYIFVNQHVQVIDCEVVLTQPSPANLKIYPSDHFGLMATLEIP